MNTVDQATKTQLMNIQQKTGKSLEEVSLLVQHSGLAKHSQIREMLIRDLALGYGDANTLAHFVLKSDGEQAANEQEPSTDEVLNGIYTGAKAPLRPIHDSLMQAIAGFGAFEIAPKKGYVSLRRKKQFAMIGPATNKRVELGLNVKNLEANDRLIAVPAGGMCNFKVNLTDPAEVDAELIQWIRTAFDNA